MDLLIRPGGRASRKQYGLALLCILLVLALFGGIVAGIGYALGSAGEGLKFGLIILLFVLAVPLAFLTTYILANLVAKRLHDIGMPAWHGIWLVALAVGTAFTLNHDGRVAMGIGVFLGLVALIGVILLCCLPGDNDYNDYGPVPR